MEEEGEEVSSQFQRSKKIIADTIEKIQGDRIH